jgi:glycosyltransferase involved in cell wall biosynthesis
LQPSVHFVCNHRDIADTQGGVQRCTREYLSLLDAAGVAVEIHPVEVDLSLSARLARRLGASAYQVSMSSRDLQAVGKAAHGKKIVLCNQVNLINAVASTLRSDGTVRKPRLVALSHGAEITDMIHDLNDTPGRHARSTFADMRSVALGRTLGDEVRSRRRVDGVVCLSESDVIFERWYGTPRTLLLARDVSLAPLDWRPAPATFGFVGTLDHLPNSRGLVDVCDDMKRRGDRGVTIEVVTGSLSAARSFAERYSFVRVLGPLSDAELAQRARQWRAFLNPIFVYARGASTKMSQALGWTLPIVTTPHGRRGYVWKKGSVIEANTPAGFVNAMKSLLDDATLAVAKGEVEAAARTAPARDELATALKTFLESLHEGCSASL